MVVSPVALCAITAALGKALGYTSFWARQKYAGSEVQSNELVNDQSLITSDLNEDIVDKFGGLVNSSTMESGDILDVD